MAERDGVLTLLAKEELVDLLRQAGEEIVTEWSRSLKASSFANYSETPIDELESDCRQCLEGYIAVIASGDQAKIRRFLHREVRARVSQGFRASEIARKFCGFETAAWSFVVERFATRPVELSEALARVRNSVTLALFEFSDMYQSASQQQVDAYLAEMEAMNRRLEEISVRDALTGLYNRRYFQDRLVHEFARSRRHLRPLSLIMVDIDHFKRINDTYGHQIGDHVLRGVGILLVNQTRATDVTARYGGEEFVAVLPETDADGAMRVAEKLREAVAHAPLHRMVPEQESQAEGPEGTAIYCTVSLGVASFAGEGMQEPSEGMQEPSALIRDADAALYAAKNSGRNRAVAAWTMTRAVDR